MWVPTTGNVRIRRRTLGKTQRVDMPFLFSKQYKKQAKQVFFFSLKRSILRGWET